jgi:hypothetical protein
MLIASVAGKGIQLKPIHNDIGRILSNINHSFVFDRQGKLFGIFLLGKPKKIPYQKRRSPRRRTSSRRSYERR